MQTIETDYLVIGAGAVGLAFADTLLEQDASAHVTFVDKHAKPGGHWNDAYPFVALHQPSATYGINSLDLGLDRIDRATVQPGVQFFERVIDGRSIRGCPDWLARSRVDPAARAIEQLKREDPTRLGVIQPMQAASMKALPNLQRLVAEAQKAKAAA